MVDENLPVRAGPFSEDQGFEELKSVNEHGAEYWSARDLQPRPGKSPDRYLWVVPGVGWVKQEDYWSDDPPAIHELTCISVAPVYRFWSPVHSRHFYTISEAEKRKLITNDSSIWTYEGVAWYACP